MVEIPAGTDQGLAALIIIAVFVYRAAIVWALVWVVVQLFRHFGGGDE